MAKSKKKKVTFFDILKIMFKRVKLSTLLLLVVTCASTSFAWFVYSTKVTTGITAHIESWEILFTNSETELSEYVNFVIPNLYPGMADYTDTINIVNLGEKSAYVTYEITAVRLLDTTYTIDGNPLTPQMMEAKLADDFPFHIEFTLANSSIDYNHGMTTFTLSANWPYESGDDEADTDWGNRAYTYNTTHSGTPSISITVRITAAQSTA